MTGRDAVDRLGKQFPFLKSRIEEDDLWDSPHIAYSLLATEVLQNSSDEALFGDLSRFIDELAGSGDSLLEELLVIDIFEGIAQDPFVADKLKTKIGLKAIESLVRVEKEFFGRSVL